MQKNPLVTCGSREVLSARIQVTEGGTKSPHELISFWPSFGESDSLKITGALFTVEEENSSDVRIRTTNFSSLTLKLYTVGRSRTSMGKMRVHHLDCIFSLFLFLAMMRAHQNLCNRLTREFIVSADRRTRSSESTNKKTFVRASIYI